METGSRVWGLGDWGLRFKGGSFGALCVFTYLRMLAAFNIRDRHIYCPKSSVRALTSGPMSGMHVHVANMTSP